MFCSKTCYHLHLQKENGKRKEKGRQGEEITEREVKEKEKKFCMYRRREPDRQAQETNHEVLELTHP